MFLPILIIVLWILALGAGGHKRGHGKRHRRH